MPVFAPSTSTGIPWSRVVAEALVIVVSILLAFGIDAGWDRERAEGLDLLERLEAAVVQARDTP